jgi:hypothetical protein
MLFDELPRLLSRNPVLASKILDFIFLPAGYAIAVLIPATGCFLVRHVTSRSNRLRCGPKTGRRLSRSLRSGYDMSFEPNVWLSIAGGHRWSRARAGRFQATCRAQSADQKRGAPFGSRDGN